MRYLPLCLLLFLAVFQVSACAQGAVLVIIDGMGSSYLNSHVATYASGAAIEPISLKSFDRAMAQYQLKVPVPATEYGHAVIVTGYSKASQETLTYYHATIFDALEDDGYLALGILENGDSKEMLGELDAAVHNKNESIYKPDIEFLSREQNVPADIAYMMESHARLGESKAGKDPYKHYIEYNEWAVGFATDVVRYMGERHPGQNYVLIVNAGGLDSAGHSFGYDGYRAVLTGLDDAMGGLVDACEETGTILMVTGDHGMSFPDQGKKGSHSAPDVASRNESVLVPLLIYPNTTMISGGVYGQECLAPTLLSLLDEPNTLSVCDGEPIPIKDRPALYSKMDTGEQAKPSSHTWMAYAAVAGISATGICIALSLAQMRK
ncbi:putative arylsulfatase A and related enzyme [Methanocella conradii HZ254]|uniref:Arylsulfatase A and related enzyme n=1 Tax=Methanocella conradii (strain DSM 24694 / JCM 17849 / CGMCC 1.5162 / HZ254) TaxID=1041930 RepID=H8I5Z1_METCZ|nr:alkaline phosphatase family protein [Methanocella conradii]AFD00225.1 putative arylsulfatase A and related enzyme [Methanocella conradii HZ254]